MNSIFRTAAPIRQISRSFSATSTRANLNKVQLIGRVGADPTVTDVGGDRRVVNYTVATSETRPDKEEGQLRYSDYTDKEGIQRTKADIYQSNFRFLTPSMAHAQENE
ncbi:hypothetical protein [Absidia glauca]|uniref:ApaG domain-containing protein n=1 Tax=Absidia glauca TaxID=4829 RepID=A0A168L1A7_ABSGL|nr:hypothetical protein [Absidia glauca]